MAFTARRIFGMKKLRRMAVLRKERLDLLRQLSSVETGEKNSLWKKHRHSQSQLLFLDAAEESYVRILGVLLLVIVLGIILATPFLIQEKFPRTYYDFDAGNPVVFWIFYVILTLFFIYLLTAPLVIKKKSGIRLPLSAFTFSIIIFTIAGATVYVLHLVSRNGDQLASNIFLFSLVAAISYFLGLLFITLVLLIPYEMLISYNKRRHITEGWTMHLIIHALAIAEKEFPRGSLQKKKELVDLLEELAFCFEVDFPKRLTGRDHILSDTVKKDFKAVATHIRNMGHQVCFSAPWTQKDITEQLSKMLVDISTGNWRALRKAEPRQIPKPRHIGAVLVRFVYVCLLSVTPLAIVLYLKDQDVIKDPGMANYLVVASAAWLAVSLIMIIDPRFKEKLEILKDIASLPGFSKEKK